MIESITLEQPEQIAQWPTIDEVIEQPSPPIRAVTHVSRDCTLRQSDAPKFRLSRRDKIERKIEAHSTPLIAAGFVTATILSYLIGATIR